MRLQINDAGSWRHILAFNAADEKDVRQRAVKLVCVVNERATLRILNDKAELKATCHGPSFTWEEKSK
jgi:hypothetical protein